MSKPTTQHSHRHHIIITPCGCRHGTDMTESQDSIIPSTSPCHLTDKKHPSSLINALSVSRPNHAFGPRPHHPKLFGRTDTPRSRWAQTPTRHLPEQAPITAHARELTRDCRSPRVLRSNPPEPGSSVRWNYRRACRRSLR